MGIRIGILQQASTFPSDHLEKISSMIAVLVLDENSSQLTIEQNPVTTKGSSHPREHCKRQAFYLDLKPGTPHLWELESVMQKRVSRSVSGESSYPCCSVVHSRNKEKTQLAPSRNFQALGTSTSSLLTRKKVQLSSPCLPSQQSSLRA